MPLHGGNTGSSPVGDANNLKDVLESSLFAEGLKGFDKKKSLAGRAFLSEDEHVWYVGVEALLPPPNPDWSVVTVADMRFHLSPNETITKFHFLKLLPLCLLLGCSATIPKESALFPGMESTFDMQDQFGRVTHFSLAPLSHAGCEADGEFIDMTITKDEPGAYWQPTIAGALDHWIMRHDANGQWRAVHSIQFNTGTNLGWDTQEMVQQPGLRSQNLNFHATGEAYVIVPTGQDEHATLSGSVVFTESVGNNFDCTLNTAFSKGVGDWTSAFSTVQARTPFYSGPAVMNEQFEGCDWNPTVCGHERWYFAPGAGLVEIDDLTKTMQGEPLEPLYIKRVN